MTTLPDLQIAFFDMLAAFERYSDTSCLITVFGNNDPRIESNTWFIGQIGFTPVFWLSDPLYALYCAHEGIENTVSR